jgi:peptide/nickel transport system substrate-binding protein
MQKIRFLLAVLLAVTGIQTGFGGGQSATPSGGTASSGAGKYKQAPILNNKNLPPVDQRLPADPLVITPVGNIGKYGGMWRQSVLIDHKEQTMAYSGYYEGRNLVVWSIDHKEIIPNLASSYTISPDGKDYTFVLRRDLKWSNGDPFTTEDIRFWFEDYYSVSDLYQGPGLNGTIEIKDPITFVIHFNGPNPLFIYTMAWYTQGLGINIEFFYPDEYLKKFHKKYNNNVDAEARAAGFSGWQEYFRAKRNYIDNAELPTMSPWMLTTKDPSAATMVFERNPYFWAVDTAGNQLPYIDTVQVNIVGSPDVAKMRGVAGEEDMQISTIMENFSDYPLFAENVGTGNYKVFTSFPAEPNAMNIHINSQPKDAGKRAIMGKADFRKALSLALNRENIINVSFSVGPQKSTPRNFAPYPGSNYLDLEMANNYAQYDSARANSMLDALGLNRKNAAGKRLLPDGRVLTLVIDVPTYADDWINIGTQIAECWQAVGLDVSARAIAPSQWDQRVQSNDYDVSVMTGFGGFAVPSPSEINAYTGYNNYDWPVAYQVGNIIWRTTGGKDGFEPDADIKRLWELGSAAVVEGDSAKRDALIKDIFSIHKKNQYVLGIGTRLPFLYIVKNTMHNVPPLEVGYVMGAGGHGRSSQYYLD